MDETLKTFSTDLASEGKSLVHISEGFRPETRDASYSSKALVREESDNAELRGYLRTDDGDEDEPGRHVVISFAAYHVQDSETDRLFHVNISYAMDWDEARRWRDWLDFVIKHGEP